jgi:predicted  nucleic acid-binding Zn-ribbon protein
MIAEVQMLIDIQELDREIQQVKNKLAAYPRMWDEVKGQLAKAKADLEAAQAERESHVKERKRVETKLRALTDDMRRTAAQQSTIKTQKEFEALNRQMEALRVRIGEKEEEGVKLLSRDDVVEAAVQKATAALAAIEATASTEKERIRVLFNEGKEYLKRLEADRARQYARVSPEMRRVYERVSLKHPGTGIVAVQAGSCGGCHFRLLPETLVNVHLAKEVTFCSNCGRLLSHDENFVGAGSVEATG